ncbi:type 4a pilus biogenesis protein PilO [Candidatus Omnitrophota bacterium]
MRFAPLFKRSLSKKEWNLLIICIIIVGVVLSNFAIRQTFLKFKGLREEIVLTNKELNGLIRVIGKQEQIDGDYAQAVSGLRQIATSDDFLKQIEGFALQAGLNIRSIKPAATKQEALYKIYSARIEAHNDISTLAKFLSVLTSGVNGIGINQLQISAQRTNEPPKANLEISAIAFNE